MPGFIATITLIGLACFSTIIGRLLSSSFTRTQIVGYNMKCVSDIFEAKVVTLLKPIKKLRPRKWDTQPLRMSKKLPKRRKLAILQSYEDKMAKGYDRAKILGQLGKKLGVTDRQVERILAQAKQYKEEIEHHWAELSRIALQLASNLNRQRKNLAHHGSYELVYGGSMYEMTSPDSGQLVELTSIDKAKALNLLAHLKEEDAFPELASLEDWANATDEEATEDFIHRLTLKANQGDFRGKCPDCPR